LYAVEYAAKCYQIDPSALNHAKVWSACAPTWHQRCKDINIAWGAAETSHSPGSVTAKIKSVDGKFISCRPLELVGSKPAALFHIPQQILVITLPAAAIQYRPNKAQKYLPGLEYKLQMSERLIRCTIQTHHDVIVSARNPLAPVQIRHFLLPPHNSSLNIQVPNVHRDQYAKAWPSSVNVSDGKDLFKLFNNGNNGVDTLVLLAHSAYQNTGITQWAHEMRHFSNGSSFGIAYR